MNSFAEQRIRFHDSPLNSTYVPKQGTSGASDDRQKLRHCIGDRSIYTKELMRGSAYKSDRRLSAAETRIHSLTDFQSRLS